MIILTSPTSVLMLRSRGDVKKEGGMSSDANVLPPYRIENKKISNQFIKPDSGEHVPSDLNLIIRCVFKGK